MTEEWISQKAVVFTFPFNTSCLCHYSHWFFSETDLVASYYDFSDPYHVVSRSSEQTSVDQIMIERPPMTSPRHDKGSGWPVYYVCRVNWPTRIVAWCLWVNQKHHATIGICLDRIHSVWKVNTLLHICCILLFNKKIRPASCSDTQAISYNKAERAKAVGIRKVLLSNSKPSLAGVATGNRYAIVKMQNIQTSWVDNILSLHIYIPIALSLQPLPVPGK